MAFLPEDIDAFNADVNKWTKEAKTELVDEVNALIDNPANAVRNLKTAQRKNAGVVNKISFKFPRYMVFVHKGVGRGTTITQVGSTNRKAKPWFNPVIEKNMEQLVDIVADHQGAMVLNAVMIK